MKHLIIYTLLVSSFVLQGQNLTDQLNTIRIDHDLMGGIVVTFCEDQTLEIIPFGKANLSQNTTITDSTRFRIASISKTITALAILQLYEEELLDLNADINTILGYSVRNPSHPNIPITTRMLLSHTSSIIDGSTYNSFLGATFGNDTVPDIRALINPYGSFFDNSLFNASSPGKYFQYSNLNYGILGTIVEKASGLRFDRYCKQHILSPLGIEGSFNINDISNLDNLAVLYRKPNGLWTPQSDDFQGIYPEYSDLTNYTPGENGLRFSPQGGLRVSGVELARIFQTLLHQGAYNDFELLQAETVEELFATDWEYDGTNGNNYYGLFRSWGLGVHKANYFPNGDVVLPGSQQMSGHPGEAYGLISDAYIDFNRKLGFVFLTNGSGTGYSIGNTSAFYTLEDDVFQAIEEYGILASCAISATELQAERNSFSTYPNPVSEIIYVETSPKDRNAKLLLFDLFGRLLAEKVITDSIMELDLSMYSRGLYYISSNGSIKKVIKQ